LVRLIEGHDLSDIVKSWKNFSAHLINRQQHNAGSLWQEGYWDRLVRDASYLFRCREYIRRNPVKANLAPSAFRLHISETTY